MRLSRKSAATRPMPRSQHGLAQFTSFGPERKLSPRGAVETHRHAASATALGTEGAAPVADFEDGSIPRYCLGPGCRGWFPDSLARQNFRAWSGRASRTDSQGQIACPLEAAAESTGSPAPSGYLPSPPGHGSFACTSLRRVPRAPLALFV
jgi:hypothetical protein